MGDIEVDITGLKKFQKQLSNLDKDRFFDEAVKVTARKLLRTVILETPVDTGELRRSWSTDNKTLDVQKDRNVYHITIINSKKYASYVENGHRVKKQNGWGWTEGRFMLKKSEEAVKKVAPQLIRKKLEKCIREVDK
jgi:hypothetical protein